MAEGSEINLGLGDILDVALKLTTSVKELVETITNAEKIITELGNEINNLHAILKGITQIAILEPNDGPVSTALRMCLGSLDELEKKLKKSENSGSRRLFFSKEMISDSIVSLQGHENRVGMTLLATTSMYVYSFSLGISISLYKPLTNRVKAHTMGKGWK